jgi:hypothetical protein
MTTNRLAMLAARIAGRAADAAVAGRRPAADR